MYAATVAQSNSLLSSGSTIRLLKEHPQAFKMLGTPGTLGKVARDVLSVSAAERAYIDAIPPALQEAIRSAIYTSVDGGKPVQLSFAPAYDFEVHVWDYGEATSIQVKGPYAARSPAGKRKLGAKAGVQRGRAKPARRRAKGKPARRRSAR